MTNLEWKKTYMAHSALHKRNRGKCPVMNEQYFQCFNLVYIGFICSVVSLSRPPFAVSYGCQELICVISG